MKYQLNNLYVTVNFKLYSEQVKFPENQIIFKNLVLRLCIFIKMIYKDVFIRLQSKIMNTT